MLLFTLLAQYASVCPIYRPLHAAAVGLLLWAWREADIDRQRKPLGTTAAQQVAAKASSVSMSADTGS